MTGSRPTSRRIIREHIFRLLFDLNFHDSREMDEQIGLYFHQVPDEDDISHPPCEVTDEERDYIAAKVKAIIGRSAQIDEEVGRVAVGWKISRMPRADLVILRLAVYEIRWDESIPTGVAINEAVELAKRYGTDATPAFVNGILAKFA